MFRGLILGAIAFAAVFAAERQLTAGKNDIKRYDRLREMSGDSTFLNQLTSYASAAIAEFLASGKGEARDLLSTLTSDIVRYAAMRSM
jgi:hypothetical protein